MHTLYNRVGYSTEQRPLQNIGSLKANNVDIYFRRKVKGNVSDIIVFPTVFILRAAT